MPKQVGFFFLFLCVVSISAFGQANGDYRSAGSGPWNTIGTWQVFSGGTWIGASATPTSTNGVITIQTGHTVNTPGAFSVSVDQVTVSGVLQINSGSTVTLVNGAGTDLTVSGGSISVSGILVQSNGVTTSGLTAANTSFLSGSTFRHLYTTTEGVIPLATWDSNSTLELLGFTPGGGSGITATAGGNWSQSFGNILYNSPHGNGRVFNFNGLLTTITGNLTVSGTGNGSIIISNGTNLTIGGTFSITAGIVNLTTGTSTVSIGAFNASGGTVNLADGTATVTVAGAFTISGATVVIGNGSSANVNLNLSNNFTLNSGTLNFTTNNTTTASLNLAGDFTATGGTITSNTNSNTFNTIRFNGTSQQTITHASTAIVLGKIDYVINSNAIVYIPASNYLYTAPTGGGTVGNFTVQSGARLRLASTNATGAIVTGTPAALGAIRVDGTATYTSGCFIEYVGTSTQFIGTGHPTGVGVNVTINNSIGVDVATSTAINGNLYLQSGNLNIGAAETLTLGGNLNPAPLSNITAATSSNLIINGTGALGNFPFPAGSITLLNLTLNRTASGSVTFVNNVSLLGTVTLTAGDLIFSDQTLSMGGTLATTAGRLYSNASSALNITGTGAFGTLIFSTSGNTLNSLSIDRPSGTVALSGSLTVNTTLNLANGDFTNSGTLALLNDVQVFRNSGAQLLGSAITPLTAGQYYNVQYGGAALTTGIELPTVANDDLGTLSILGGPVTLSQNIIVNEDFDVLSGGFNASTFNINMNGNPGNFLDPSSIFSPGTGTVNINGNVTVVAAGSPQFFNMNVNSGSTLTLPVTNVNMSGNLVVDAGSTLNNSNGTIVFNGAAAQTFSGGGKNYHNISVNNGGNDLQLTSAVNLVSVLDVQSASNFMSGGFLTLLSTADDPSDVTASINPLLNGAQVSGVVNTQRYMSGEGRIYRYISSPVSNATIADWKDDFPITGTFSDPSPAGNVCGVAIKPSSPSLYYYNEAVAGVADNGWVAYPSSGTAASNPLVVGLGYAPFIRECTSPTLITVSGIVNQDTVALPVTFTGTTPDPDGWNLIGNPYPSSIVWDAGTGWEKTNINATISIRDNGIGGVFVPLDEADGGVISSGQSFWVLATAASPELRINERAKSSVNGTFYRKRNDKDILTLLMAKGDITDKAFIRIKPEASAGIDRNDFPNQNNDFFDLATLVNGKEMAVNAMSSLSCGQVINVHVKDMTNGSYTFSINRDGLFKEFDVMLHDKYTGSIVNLSTASTYSFSVTTTAATKANNRFEIHLDHVPVDLDVAFNSNTTELCQGEDYTLRIVKPQTYVSYSAMIDGNEVSSPIDVVSEVNFIDLVVPSSALVNGQNIISVKAENYCSSEVLNQTIQLTQHGTPTTKASAITLCKGLTGELSADGAPSGGGYNWYSNSNSQTPLFSGFTFVTPVLYETTTYYVGAFNALGCEGDRVPLEVYVPPLEDASITQISKNKLESNYFSGNQWFYNGDLIEGATNQTLTVVRSGTYTVEILVGECTTTDRFEFSRNRKDIESLVSFYPNPVNNSSNLFVEVFATQLNSVSLLNTMGRKVMDINLEYFGADNWAGYLNMESIHAGIYFLKVDADGKTESHRIIVSQQ